MSRSAIDKRPVDSPVYVGALGLEGDEQFEKQVHGGPDKAVYAYALEDLAWWSAQLGRPIAPGFIGENLTLEGIDLGALRPGDELFAGEVVLRVTEPRDPCSKLAARIGEPSFVKRFGRAARTGAYCAVDRPGRIARDDAVTVVTRAVDGPTIRDLVRAKFGADGSPATAKESRT
jgi:MOSC domain-containing protein YiiM